MTHNVTLIPGDWIGPECCAAVQRIIAAAGVDIQWDVHSIQGQLSEELLASCRQNRVVLKARTAASQDIGTLPLTVELRKHLGLWATQRPVRALAGVNARHPNVDLVVIRETSEDIYSGFEHVVTEGVYEAVKVTTPAACKRIALHAYEYARKNGRKKVTIVHKSNIMKKSDGLFLQAALEVSKAYPEIETSKVIVDALCMQLVRWPESFDVLLTLNLFGDIVSDLSSGLAGGITASPSVSFSDEVAMFECLHGKTPSLVGQDKANPIPVLNAALMMLDHLNEGSARQKIQAVIDELLLAGLCTEDLGGELGLSEFTQCVVDRLSV